VHGSGEFADAAGVWWKLSRQNPKLGKLLDTGEISDADAVVIRAAKA
jgi:hypothetical protein